MKKLLLIVTAFVCLSGVAHADPPRKMAITNVFTAAQSSIAVASVDIPSHPAAGLILDLNFGYTQICIQNIDTAKALNCGETVNVSSITTNGLHGVIIPPAASATQPATPMCFALSAGMDWYCRTQSVTAATRAVVIRAR